MNSTFGFRAALIPRLLAFAAAKENTGHRKRVTTKQQLKDIAS
jgi:hypothetical protein